MDRKQAEKRLHDLDTIEQHIMFSHNFLTEKDKEELENISKERKQLEELILSEVIKNEARKRY